MLFSFIVLAFRGFPPWEVISGRSLRYSVRFGRALRGKFGKTADDTDVTDGFLDWRLTQTHYNWMPDWARWVRQPSGALPVSYLRYPCNPWVNSILAQGSRLLFLAEFLESGIAAQRIPDRIESKKGWRNGRPAGIRGIGRL